MKGEVRYAGGAARFALAAAVVLVVLAVSVAFYRSDSGRARSVSAPGPSTRVAPSPALSTPSTSAAPATSTGTPDARTTDVPPILVDHLTYGAKRRGETAAYAQRHYGTRTATLRPTMIVLHYSESDTYASVRSVFEADEPNLGELPGTCAHYVVDQAGTIHEVVPPTLICRHTVGLNDVAIGIEFVQSSQGHDPRWATRQVLARKAQVAAGVALVEALQRRFAIPEDKVIGHAMANDAKEFRDLAGWRNDHLDWQAPEVAAFRRLLTTAP